MTAITNGEPSGEGGHVGKFKIVPDTNIWRYIVDADAVEEVRLAARRCQITLVACPAVVYEMLRTGNRQVRRRLAKAVTRGDWERPMPEVFIEAQAVRHEIARLHPEWLAPNPDLRTWRLDHADWQGGFWRRVRSDPDHMSQIISTIEGRTLERAREEATTARGQAISVGRTPDSLSLATAEATFVQQVEGWDGRPFEPWRGFSAASWWDAVVRGRQTTARDWLGPWLNLPMIRSQHDAWLHMWIREVDTAQLPREWIRWAMREVQAVRKVTAGTPVDNQIATYLPDFDMFVTADRGFAQCIDAIRGHAPTKLSEVSAAPAGAKAVEHLLRLFEANC